MTKIFVDTSGWGHLADPQQQFSRKAADIYKKARSSGGIVTTNYVMSELTALLMSPLRLTGTKRIAILNGIRTSSFIDIIHIDATLDERAWKLLQQRSDKSWSLADCSSFVLMAELGITDALTTDHNFEQAGLVRLLK